MEDIITQVKSGDSDAYALLYKANVDHIYALCLRMSGNRHLAGELTQDVFVRAWEKIHQFAGNSAFSTWLHKLAVNQVLTHFKKRQTIEDREQDIDLDIRHPETRRNMASDEKIDLEQAILHLPERERFVLTLHDIEGYKHAEIGEWMGISTQTSRVYLHNARKLLRETLK